MEKAINKTFNASRHFQLTNYEVGKKFAGYMRSAMTQEWFNHDDIIHIASHIGYYMNHKLNNYYVYIDTLIVLLTVST